MAEYQVEYISDKEVWEKFVLSRNTKSFLQSWNWGETNKLLGDKIFRMGLKKYGQLVGVCLIIKQRAKRGPHFLIPGGPLIDWSNNKLVNFLLSAIRDLGKKEKAWFIRVRPELADTLENQGLFSRLGFISAPMHLHAENTWVLNIDKSDDDLFKGMRKNTRYSIRKSLQIGLSVEETTSPEKTRILEMLQNETVERHKFVGFPDKLFKAQLQTFGKDGQARLYICRKDAIPLVAAIIIFYGDYAYYHHSASSEKAREVPASYFLQWRIIQDAKKRYKKFYNFWGIAPNDDPKHRFAGVTTFKKGFGGERIDWLHAGDLKINPLYYFTYFFETVRRESRRL